MLYWKSRNRLEVLREFRDLVECYFQNVVPTTPGRAPQENQSATGARVEINRRLPGAAVALSAAGMHCRVYYAPPPAVGGLAGEVDLLQEIFNLWRLRISHRRIIDCLDRAIGWYDEHTKWLFKQIFNPLFWLKWLFVKLLRMPFEILHLAGYDVERWEKSALGKLVKGVIGLVTFVAAFLKVLDYLGFLAALRQLLGGLSR